MNASQMLTFDAAIRFQITIDNANKIIFTADNAF